MTFSYTYRSSDGQRHAAEIEAESRDAAFARLRTEFGIKPIRVVEKADGGDKGVKGFNGLKGSIGLVIAALLLVALAAWLWNAARPDAAPYQVMTPQGPVTYAVTTPLPRQMIPGDRTRIDAARETAFKSPAERFLAHFAEPGRLPPPPSQPSDEDFFACLKEPIRIASNDFTEVVDLKRIVTGMKQEMRVYLAAGGTVAQYLAELVKRQRLEISYRENAERKLNEMLVAAESHSSQAPQTSPTSQTSQISQTPPISTPYQSAYAYWLKANAQLQAMGIYPLALPDALRTYQMGLELEN